MTALSRGTVLSFQDQLVQVRTSEALPDATVDGSVHQARLEVLIRQDSEQKPPPFFLSGVAKTMKKILFSLAALTVAGTVLAQVPVVTVSPRAIRTYGDNIELGQITVFGTTAGGAFAACGAQTTVRGQGFIGHSANRHSVVCTVVFDKAQLNAVKAAQILAGGTGEMNILLENALNANTLTHTVRATLTNMGVARVVFEGQGPFNIRNGVGADDWYDLIADGSEGEVLSQSRLVNNPPFTDPITLLPSNQTVGNYRLPLPSGGSGGGGGMLDVCLGPTGQVRMIDDGNNGDWAAECVANGWRLETIALGAAPIPTAWDKALASPSPFPLNTFGVTCWTPPFVLPIGTGQAQPVTIDEPLAISFTQVDAGNLDHRGYHALTPGLTSMQINSQNPLPGFARIKIEVH